MERENAIAHVKDMYEHMFFREDKEALETLIPELRESEDERIRKWIYNLVSDLDSQDDDAEKELDEMKPLALTWLEKQKARKLASTCRNCKYSQQRARYDHTLCCAKRIVNKYYKKVVRPTETCELFERKEDK